MPSSVAASLTGLGVRSVAPAAPAIGPGHAHGDVVAGAGQRAQGRHRQVGGAEIRQAGHPFTVGQRSGAAAGAGVGGARAAQREKRLESPSGSTAARSNVRLRRILSASLR